MENEILDELRKIREILEEIRDIQIKLMPDTWEEEYIKAKENYSRKICPMIILPKRDFPHG